MKSLLVYGVYYGLTVPPASLTLAARKWPMRPTLLWPAVVLFSLGSILFLSIFSEPAPLFSDFNKAYYPAGRAILRHPHDLYGRTEPNNTVACFTNIPIVALLFTPISALGLAKAHRAFTLLGVAAVVASIQLLIRLTGVRGWKAIALVGLFVVNGPLYNSLREGNLTHFVLLLLVGAWFCLENNHDIWLGILLAAAALIKIPLFLFCFFLLLNRRWRALQAFVATAAGVVALSLVLFGVDLHLLWYHTCIEPTSGKALAAFNVQSVNGFLARVLTDAPLSDWLPVAVDTRFKLLHGAILSALGAGVLIALRRSSHPTDRATDNLDFSIFLCLALIVSPISWTHYYLLLLLPLSLCLAGRLAVPQTIPWFLATGLAALLVSAPATLIESNILWVRLLISHYLFGGMLLLVILLAARWRFCREFPAARPATVLQNA